MATPQTAFRIPVHVRDRRSNGIFFVGYTAAAIALVFAGFGPSYYLRPLTDAPPLSGLVQLHAVLFSGWMVLFALQVSLVARRRVHLHRRLGAAGVAFALAMLVVAWVTAVEGARTGWVGPNAPRDMAGALPFLVIPVRDLGTFAGFFAAAIYYRRQPETHKRLMVLAMVGGILPAAAGRLPSLMAIASLVALLLAGPLYDRWRLGRVHPAYKWGIPPIVGSVVLAVAVRGTETWRAVAAWLIS